MDVKMDLDFKKIMELCCEDCRKKLIEYAKNNAKIVLSDDDIINNFGGKK